MTSKERFRGFLADCAIPNTYSLVLVSSIFVDAIWWKIKMFFCFCFFICQRNYVLMKNVMKVLKQQNVFTCRRNYILTNFSIDPLSKPPRMSENKYPWSPLRRRSTSSRIRESVFPPRSSGSSDRRSGWAKPESDSSLFRFSSSEAYQDRVPPRPRPPRW